MDTGRNLPFLELLKQFFFPKLPHGNTRDPLLVKENAKWFARYHMKFVNRWNFIAIIGIALDVVFDGTFVSTIGTALSFSAILNSAIFLFSGRHISRMTGVLPDGRNEETKK